MQSSSYLKLAEPYAYASIVGSVRAVFWNISRTDQGTLSETILETLAGMTNDTPVDAGGDSAAAELAAPVEDDEEENNSTFGLRLTEPSVSCTLGSQDTPAPTELDSTGSSVDGSPAAHKPVPNGRVVYSSPL